MKLSTILLVLMIPVMVFTAIELSHFINGLQARKVNLKANQEQFVSIARAHGFAPASDIGQIVKCGLRVLVGLSLLGVAAFAHSNLVG